MVYAGAGEQLTVLGLAQVGKSLSSYRRQTNKPPANWHLAACEKLFQTSLVSPERNTQVICC